MGRNGECAAEATFRLSCPHKAVFESCSNCVTFAFQQKCGCSDEAMIPIIPAAPLAVTQPTDSGSNEKRLDVFKWIEDGSEKGHIVDQSGNKFVWNRGLRQDGNFGYRCHFKLDKDGATCPATARRFVKTEGDSTILLETPHKHSSASLVVKKEPAAKRSKTTSGSKTPFELLVNRCNGLIFFFSAGESSGSSGSKQRRMSESN